jgi:dUTP pyrophosphatase
MDELVVQVGRRGLRPIKGTPGSAGYDLYASVDCCVPAFGRAIVETDIKICLPPGTYGRIAPRSGLAIKHFIDVGAGVVDSDYRGDIRIVVFNFGETDYHFVRGDRVAQFIVTCIRETINREGNVDNDSLRGLLGFGSTGR